MEKEIRLLQTKFFIPRISGNLIHRKRLTQILASGKNSRIILVSAPAGFGKTSLLSDWIYETGEKPVWLTLDNNDSDPTRFMDYLVNAFIYRKLPVLGKLLSENRSQFHGNLPQQMESLLNCILDSGETITLVLDDFQHIHSQPILGLINFYIENLPPNARMIILTRSDPSLNLANWRARGYLEEIRQTDLCFSFEEASEYFACNIPFNLSREHLRSLYYKIEGWPAGMLLAINAITRQGNKTDAEKFIDTFKGTNRFILEYLLEEVLNNQPEQIRKFLFYTSLLDNFCASLCDYVLEKNDSQAQLDLLERSNLFIVPLDSTRTWYRYHRLFSDLLKSLMGFQDRKKILRIHKLASEWYELNGDYSEAIEHRFFANDNENAARLIQSQAKNVLNRSQFFTFDNWVRQLPREYLVSHQDLCAYYAITLIVEGRPNHEIREILEIMDQKKNPDNFDQTIIRIFLFILQGNFPEAIKNIKIIKEQPPVQDEFLMNLLDMLQAIVFEKDANSTFNQLLTTSRRAKAAGNYTVAITSLSYAGDLVKAQGRLHTAHDIYTEALQMSQLDKETYLPAGGIPLGNLGELYYKWNRLEEAEQFLRRSLELSPSLEISHFFSVLTTLARVEIALDKYDEANILMQKAAALAQQFDATEMDDFIVACRIIQLRLLMGEDPQIEISEDQLTYTNPSMDFNNSWLLLTMALMQEIRQLTHAWVLLHKKQYAQAIPLLTDLLTRASNNHLEDYIIQYAVLLAMAYHMNLNEEEALENIGIALKYAQKEDQIQVFLEQGIEIMDLLYAAAKRGIEPDFAGRVLSRFPQMDKIDHQEKLIHYEDEIIEPLSQRETEILELISQGLSNQEIALDLHLSLSTVKVHTYNIFRKLNVRSRIQAVSKARLINFLS